MIQTFPFLITNVGPIYFSLCSFPFYLSICRFLCLYYFMLPCFQLFILFISQNKIDVTVFFSWELAYLFIFSFHVIIIFYSIQAFVIVYSPFFSFLLPHFWSLIASKRYETGTIDLFFILFHNILSCRSTLARFVFPLFTWRIYHFLSGISCLYSKFVY